MPDAFQDQLLALIPKLRSYALGLSGSAAEADDLVQDALMRAWRSRESFESGTNLKAWIFRILRNCFIDAVKQRNQTVQDVEGKLAAGLVSTPEQEWRLEYEDLLAGIGLLSCDCRDALLLVVAHGLSYEEAAGICACPVGTMKSRVSRARDQLARHLSRGDERRPKPARPVSQPRAAMQAA